MLKEGDGQESMESSKKENTVEVLKENFEATLLNRPSDFKIKMLKSVKLTFTKQ